MSMSKKLNTYFLASFIFFLVAMVNITQESSGVAATFVVLSIVMLITGVKKQKNHSENNNDNKTL